GTVGAPGSRSLGANMILGILRDIVMVLILGTPFFLFERRFGAHPVPYRKVLARDVGALVVTAFMTIASSALLRVVPMLFPAIGALPRAVGLPPWASIPLAILGTDFGFYWTHRAIHTRPLWRVHRWHHSQRQLYWLAGARASMLQAMSYSALPLIFV